MVKKLSALIAVTLLCGCADLPTVKACGNVSYTRNGDEYELHFTKCRVMTSDPALGAVMSVVK